MYDMLFILPLMVVAFLLGKDMKENNLAAIKGIIYAIATCFSVLLAYSYYSYEYENSNILGIIYTFVAILGMVLVFINFMDAIKNRWSKINKICKRCGAENSSENLFCERCGCSDFKETNKAKIETLTDMSTTESESITSVVQRIEDKKYHYMGYAAIALIAIGFLIFKISDSSKDKKYHSNYSNTDSSKCDYDKATEYFNRYDPSQTDPEQSRNLMSCSSNNVSLHNQGVTLYCKNGTDNSIVDSSYSVVYIGDSASFSKNDNEPNIIASSCRP